MFNLKRSNRLGTLILVLVALIIAPLAFANDEDDVLATIQKYGDLEGDLEAQAKMIRDDRVYINAGVRQSDQAKNMSIQIAERKANEAVNGGKTKFITTTESPQVTVYGNVAVASFVRTFNIFPNGLAPIQGQPLWVTLVLVKESNEWGIAHTHNSRAGGN
jgi:hypothetical protein